MVKYYNPRERRLYQEKLDELKESLRYYRENPSVARYVDQGAIQKKIRNLENSMEKKSAPKERGFNKDKAWARYKELAEEIQNGMPTSSEMKDATDENVRKQVNWHENNVDSGKVKEFRNLGMILEPDDESIGNIERLRRNK